MAFQELLRTSVQTWEIDGMGHMNVQFYSEKAASALSVLSLTLGHGPSAVRETGMRLTADGNHIRFLREQRPGAAIFLRGGVASVGERDLTCYVEMVNAATNDVAAAFIAPASFKSVKTGEKVDMPDAVRQAACDLQVEIPPHGLPRGLDDGAPRPAPLLKDADALGLIRTYQGEILPDMCDAHGFLATRRFIGIVSDSIPNLLLTTRGDDGSEMANVGGAALEYRFVYRQPPRVGDIITLRAGLKQVTDKTYTWAHWLFDLESGSCVATAEAVAVALDLVARKAIPIPPEVKAKLEPLVVPGLSL